MAFCSNSITCSLEYTAGKAAAAHVGALLVAIVVVEVAATSITLKHDRRSTTIAVLSVVDKLLLKGDDKSACNPGGGRRGEGVRVCTRGCLDNESLADNPIQEGVVLLQ